MAYDETLARRIRDLLASKKGYTEKKMFGGIAFLHEGRMCCGVLRNELVARISAADYADALKKPQVRPMDFTGRPMKGYVYVASAGLRTARSLQAWLDQSAAFVKTLTAKKPARRRAVLKK